MSRDSHRRLENKKAVSVSYWKDNQSFTIKTNKEIILSAGSIGSTQILQTSGIGDAKKLSPLGIDIVKNSIGVGKNLQDHLMFRPVYKVNNIKTLNKKINSLIGKLMIGMEYVFLRKGPMTMGASQLCGFAKSDSSRSTPNLQFHVQPISTDKLGGSNLHDFDAFTPTVANIRPTSKGEINIISKDSRVNPKIKMNYLSSPDDRKVAAAGLRLIRKIVLESDEFKKSLIFQIYKRHFFGCETRDHEKKDFSLQSLSKHYVRYRTRDFCNCTNWKYYTTNYTRNTSKCN